MPRSALVTQLFLNAYEGLSQLPSRSPFKAQRLGVTLTQFVAFEKAA